VNQHIRAGGAAVVLEEQATVKRIKLYGHGCECASLSTHHIPITRKGGALHRVRSAMFATASAHSLGIGAEEIAYGLRTFTGR
jgi:cyanophycin synthetase